MAKQKVLFEDLDNGIKGVFVEEIESSELGYVFIRFVPLNSLPPKTIQTDKHYKKEHIHRVHYPSSAKGVIKNVVYVYSGEMGSGMREIMGANNERKIQELQDEIERLTVQVATRTTESEIARSGVNKTIAENKSMARNSFDSGSYGGSSSYPSSDGYGGGNEYDDDYGRREESQYRH